jgi:hypothetical protein
MAGSDNARANLRKASAQYRVAELDLEFASLAVVQGRDLLTAAKAEADHLRHLDVQAAEGAAERILKAAQSGLQGIEAAHPPDITPFGEADRKLVMANEILRMLQDKEAAARALADEAFKAVRSAAIAALSEGGDLLADELKGQHERTAILRSTLLGLGMLRVQPDQPFPLSVKVREALTLPEAQLMPGQDSIRLAQRAWKDQFEALLENPDAALELHLTAESMN